MHMACQTRVKSVFSMITMGYTNNGCFLPKSKHVFLLLIFTLYVLFFHMLNDFARLCVSYFFTQCCILDTEARFVPSEYYNDYIKNRVVLP